MPEVVAALAVLGKTPGFDINSLTSIGKPLIDFLLEERRFVVVQLLLESGADPFNTLIKVIGVRAEGIEREIQNQIIDDCLNALEGKARANTASPKEADHLLFTQLQKAVEAATKLGDTNTIRKIKTIIEEQKLADGEPGGRFANNGEDRKKGGNEQIKTQPPRAKDCSQSAKTRKGAGRAPHKSKRNHGPGKDAKYALCMQKMQPWGLPVQRTANHNPQKPRVRLLG